MNQEKQEAVYSKIFTAIKALVGKTGNSWNVQYMEMV